MRTLLDGAGLDAPDGRAQLVGQVATGPLELPRRPVTATGRQAALAHPAAEVGPGVHVDDLGAEEPLEPRPLRSVGHLDLDLAGALPQHAGHAVAVSLELVPHLVAPSLRLGSNRGDRGVEKTPRVREGHP